MKTFEQLLGQDNPILKVLNEKGFDKPTEIQEKSIPEILKGKDVIAGASTGSGKTLAFLTGLIKNAKKDFGIQGLVLTPTRELAEQITNEIIKFSEHKDLDIMSVYGGVSMRNQVKRLQLTDIVVGTPGRILDHINKNSINLNHINTLVLDEADRMLDMGFRDDVEKIIKRCSKKRQTLFFSATISSDVFLFSKKFMSNPVEVSAKPHVDAEKLEQVYYDVREDLKYSLLQHLIENEESKLVIIFCNTRKNVDFITNNLKLNNIQAIPLHGGYTQDKRNRIMERFHSKKSKVLVATDVAARGLDIQGISHIYNYDIPKTLDEYIHRIGRTARAGEKGKIINIVVGQDYNNFGNVMSGDFEIKREETPAVKKRMLKWMSPKSGNRRNFNRDNRNDHRKRTHSKGNENYRKRSEHRKSEDYKRRDTHKKRTNHHKSGHNRRWA